MKDNVFGKNLKELRLENRMSQKQLGDILHVCNQTVSFWETGAREPDLDNLLSIADYFDVTVDYLLKDN